MNPVNQTLYIPLYGKALVSKQGIILHDCKAEAIWDSVRFPLKAKSKSKWLAYFMGMRAKVFDDWLSEMIHSNPSSAVLHLGCGLDSRVLRVGCQEVFWYDIDFPQVIDERKQYYQESENYRMISMDVTDPDLMNHVRQGGTALIVMEGISMYLPDAQLRALLGRLRSHFDTIHILMDCYTSFSARVSKYKNPINDVGVTQVYGQDDPYALATDTGLLFVNEPVMTPEPLINQLSKQEQRIFRTLYAGRFAKRMYRMYEFHSK